MEAVKKTKEAELAVTLMKKEQEIKKLRAMERVYAESANLEKVGSREPAVMKHDNNVASNKKQVDRSPDPNKLPTEVQYGGGSPKLSP